MFVPRLLRLSSLAGLCALFVAPAQGQDLGALARKEKERRAKIANPGKVLTEEDGKAAGAKGTGSVTALAGESPSSPTEVERQPGLTLDQQKASWKERAAAARAAVADAQTKLAQMERDLGAYRSDVVPATAAEIQDPMRLQKREAAMVEMNKQIEVQKGVVADAKKALSALEDEARKSGVPAGWLR